MMLEIFNNDIKKKFKSTKVKIIYDSIMVQMINMIFPRFIDLVFGFIFKKFPILAGRFKALENFENPDQFLFHLGYDAKKKNNLKVAS